jgi:hypothetical protein
MPFGETKALNAQRATQKRTQFLKLQAGIGTTIRIIGKEQFDYTHYINGTTVLCLGEDCPVCLNNKRLYLQYPKTFKNETNYSSRSKRYSVNVLDKTLVKKCECGLEYADMNVVTCTCGKILTTPPQPSMTIKVLSKGPTLFDPLFAINDAILDEQGERIGIDKYDISLITSGSGKTTTVTPIAHPERNTPTPDGLELYDLTKVTICLDAGEILDLQRGISLRDIFAARKAAYPVDTTVVSPDIEAQVRSEVDQLFKNAALS